MPPIDDSNLELSASVFKVVTGCNDSADTIDRILAKNGDKIVVSRELMVTLAEALRTNSKLLSSVFEENQYIMDRVASAMRKNHPHH